MKILLAGRNGQIGWELERALAPLGQVIATDRATLDLVDEEAIRRAVRAAKPDVIVNAAAYTAVDRAESERELAFAINAAAVGVLAQEAESLGALLLHYSTDYVFDGTKPAPYVEDDAPNPINAYGASKLAGERAVQASGCAHLIFRTSWVYGPRGNNFLLSILRAAREQPELRVVDDQVGAPTCAIAIARGTAEVLGAIARGAAQRGIFHMSAAGNVTWHGFATEILSRAGLGNPVAAIRSAQYAAAARRPRNSLLDNSKLRAAFGVALAGWREQLALCMSSIE